jgi:glycosyltransferase involved in cell wall biosynthesis
MKTPEISIIVPFYNRANLLLETLESIADQTYSDFEVLVVDDGSTKKSLEIAKKVMARLGPRFSYFKRPKEYPTGGNGARNFGFHKANGKYIKWFDSDDVMKPDFLEKQMRAICKHSLDGVLARCGVYNADFSELIRKDWRLKYFSEKPIEDYVKSQMGWQTNSGLWEKEKIKELNPFSETLQNAQEWIFHLKILTSNLKVGVIPEELYKMRSNERSISGVKDQNYRFNKFRSRTLGLKRLMETKSRGKKYLLKNLYVSLSEIGYKKGFHVLWKELKRIDVQNTQKCRLIYID